MVQRIMLQTLYAIDFCHQHNVCTREGGEGEWGQFKGRKRGLTTTHTGGRGGLNLTKFSTTHIHHKKKYK